MEPPDQSGGDLVSAKRKAPKRVLQWSRLTSQAETSAVSWATLAQIRWLQWSRLTSQAETQSLYLPNRQISKRFNGAA